MNSFSVPDISTQAVNDSGIQTKCNDVWSYICFRGDPAVSIVQVLSHRPVPDEIRVRSQTSPIWRGLRWKK